MNTVPNLAKHMKKINSFLYNEFIFSPRYKAWRHIIYWSFHITVWAIFWFFMGSPVSFGRNLFNMSLWIPLFMLFSYPLVYGAIPHLLLKRKVWQFFLFILVWGVIGIYINAGFRTYLYVPLQQSLGFDHIPARGSQPHSFLCMTTSAASVMSIKFFKLWTIKQRAWMQAQQEKITAELQLLKAQVHPHFLINTLNNIHSFSLESSPKTPEMILKLSSLLSYMLYDCRSEEVWLEKEIGIMKNYIDLENERYGNKIEISWSVEGDVSQQFIAPLLMLPFLENAFKHCAYGEIEQPWLGVDLSEKQHILRCKIANSKSEFVTFQHNGVGINNVKKRLEFIYPVHHELKINDEGNFFVVSMLIKLETDPLAYSTPSFITQKIPA
jgi:two-component system sensor histidine kinase AlgZ